MAFPIGSREGEPAQSQAEHDVAIALLGAYPGGLSSGDDLLAGDGAGRGS
jgi:hypothetical protein